MSKLKVTVFQSDIYWENVERNIENLDHKVNNLKDNPDLIVLPEMFSTGFSVPTGDYLPVTNEVAINWMLEVSRQRACIVTGSILVNEQNKLYNRLYWTNRGRVVSHYDKAHLFGIEKLNEHLVSGNTIPQFMAGDWKVRTLICYDLRFPVWSRNYDDYDLLIYVANWPALRSDAWLTLLKARAIENQSYVVGCNRIGTDGNGISYRGDSVVYSPVGEVLWQATPDKEEIGTISLDYIQLSEYRKKFPALRDRDNFSISI